MKKRIYRAVAVKDFDWPSFAEQLDSEDRLVVGVDVAKAVMYAALMSERQEILAVVRWNHLEQSRWVVRQLMDLPIRHVEVVLEPSGTYGDALRQCFREAGAKLFRVHPKHTKDAHELYDGVPSRHDAKCSAILGWLHLLGRSEPWSEPGDRERALSAAIRTYELHKQAFRQAQNRLEAQLARHWPELLELLKLDSASLLELLGHYGSPQRVAAAASSARRLLLEASRNALQETKIDQILASARQSLGVSPLESEREALCELAQEARRRQQLVQSAKRRIRALADQDANTRRLGAVVGEVTAVVLQAGLGRIEGYPNAGSLLKAAGLNLKERSSGQHQGRLGITKRGSSRVRQFLFLATLRWIKQDRWAHAWHQLKVTRDGGKSKLKSVVALMRKLLRGLWWVAQGKAFDSAKLFDTRRLRSVVST